MFVFWPLFTPIGIDSVRVCAPVCVWAEGDADVVFGGPLESTACEWVTGSKACSLTTGIQTHTAHSTNKTKSTVSQLSYTTPSKNLQWPTRNMPEPTGQNVFFTFYSVIKYTSSIEDTFHCNRRLFMHFGERSTKVRAEILPQRHRSARSRCQLQILQLNIAVQDSLWCSFNRRT